MAGREAWSSTWHGVYYMFQPRWATGAVVKCHLHDHLVKPNRVRLDVPCFVYVGIIIDLENV